MDYIAPEAPDSPFGGLLIALMVGLIALGLILTVIGVTRGYEGALPITGILILLVGAVGVPIASIFIGANEAYAAQISGDEERLAEIEDTYGLELTKGQLYELEYPFEEPGRSSEVYGEIKILSEDGASAQTVALAWTGEEMVLLGSPDGAELQELPRVGAEKASWAVR